MPFAGAEVALMMMMVKGHPEKSSVPLRLTLHPAGVQIANHVSPHLVAPPEEVLGTATLTETGSSQEALLIDMVKTESATLLTEARPKQMRRIDGAESLLNPPLSVSLVVLTVAALLEHPALKAAVTDGPGSPSHLHQQTDQLQRPPPSDAD